MPSLRERACYEGAHSLHGVVKSASLGSIGITGVEKDLSRVGNGASDQNSLRGGSAAGREETSNANKHGHHSRCRNLDGR
jgi:hypothetical protein